MNTLKIRNSLILLLTAAIWGVAFVAQSVGMDYVGPFTFICVRSFIGAAVLLPFILVRRRLHPAPPATPAQRRTLLLGGLCCGIFLAVASCLQQFGIQYQTGPVGKAGFITALYIVLVPLLGLFVGRRCPLPLWLGVGLALAGLYFLCLGEGFTLCLADGLLLLCALFFAGHILVIDRFTARVDGVTMAAIQFTVCALLCLGPMLLLEQPAPERLLEAWLPILYAGALSSGVAYTLQIVGQRGLDPTLASLILSLESVISVLAGQLLLGQQLSPREGLGCCLMFAAIVLAQLPERRRAPSDP